MAATAGHRLTLNPIEKCSNMNIMRYGVNVNETTTPYFPIGSNLLTAVVAILDFGSA
jgi:hypothetical protein